MTLLQLLDELRHNGDAQGRVTLSREVLEQVTQELKRAGEIEALAAQMIQPMLQDHPVHLTREHEVVQRLVYLLKVEADT